MILVRFVSHVPVIRHIDCQRSLLFVEMVNCYNYIFFSVPYSFANYATVYCGRCVMILRAFLLTAECEMPVMSPSSLWKGWFLSYIWSLMRFCTYVRLSHLNASPQERLNWENEGTMRSDLIRSALAYLDSFIQCLIPGVVVGRKRDLIHAERALFLNFFLIAQVSTCSLAVRMTGLVTYQIIRLLNNPVGRWLVERCHLGLATFTLECHSLPLVVLP